MPNALQEAEVRSALARMPGWSLNSGAIQRDYQFENFVKAMEFVNRVAGAAEQAGHHPDIAISYNRVTLRLNTHDAGGITSKDIQMAETLDNLPGLRDLQSRKAS